MGWVCWEGGDMDDGESERVTHLHAALQRQRERERGQQRHQEKKESDVC